MAVISQEAIRNVAANAGAVDLAAFGLIGIGTLEGLQFLARGLDPREPDGGSLILGILWLVGGWYLGLGMLSGSVNLPGLDILRSQENPLTGFVWLTGALVAATASETVLRKTAFAT